MEGLSVFRIMTQMVGCDASQNIFLVFFAIIVFKIRMVCIIDISSFIGRYPQSFLNAALDPLTSYK